MTGQGNGSVGSNLFGNGGTLLAQVAVPFPTGGVSIPLAPNVPFLPVTPSGIGQSKLERGNAVLQEAFKINAPLTPSTAVQKVLEMLGTAPSFGSVARAQQAQIVANYLQANNITPQVFDSWTAQKQADFLKNLGEASDLAVPVNPFTYRNNYTWDVDAFSTKVSSAFNIAENYQPTTQPTAANGLDTIEGAITYSINNLNNLAAQAYNLAVTGVNNFNTFLGNLNTNSLATEIPERSAVAVYDNATGQTVSSHWKTTYAEGLERLRDQALSAGFTNAQAEVYIDAIDRAVRGQSGQFAKL